MGSGYPNKISQFGPADLPAIANMYIYILAKNFII